MDPRLAWHQPETMNKAYSLWTKIWVMTQFEGLKNLKQLAQISPQFEEEWLRNEWTNRYFEMLDPSYEENSKLLVKKNKASTFGYNLPVNEYMMKNRLTTPWLNINFDLFNNPDCVRLIEVDNENSYSYETNPCRYLLTLDSDVAPVIELDKGFIR
jgi:hypothetical protein